MTIQTKIQQHNVFALACWLTALVLISNHNPLYPQQIRLQTATAAGGTATGAGGSSSFAIGQIFYRSYSASDTQVHQGVIQLINYNSNPLPVTLLHFSAFYNPGNHTIELIWQTTAEINNDYFTIERSDDAQKFAPIGYHNGAGNSNTFLHYYFTDTNPLPGISYYRLKQTDYDGSFDYSSVIAVSIHELSPELTVYPNPASQYIHIRLNNPHLLEHSWELLSLNGRLVKRGSFSGEHETLYLADLPHGVWLLRIYRKDLSATLKIVKK